jgi:P-type Cu2+ transporter
MSCCAGPIVVDLAASRQVNARTALLNDLQYSCRLLADGSTSYILSVPAIHCGNCITRIERTIGKIDGVKSVRANLSLKRVALTLDAPQRSLDNILSALQNLGFEPQTLATEGKENNDLQLQQLLRALAISGFAAANIMLLSIAVWNGASGATRDLFHFVSALIAIPSVAFGGLPFFRSAFNALNHHRMNMDVPISLGVTLATGMSIYESLLGGGHAYFDAAVSLLFFLLIGRTLDHLMRTKARSAADGLARLSAKGGFVVNDKGALVYLALDAIEPGMRVRVAAGERIPVDGEIVVGMSDIDRSLVTGESQPQQAKVGTTVEAGTLNLTGSIDINATRTARNSFLAEVTQMMAAAESGRSQYVRIADRLARIYAPAVHVLSFTAFLGWMVWSAGDWHQSLTVAVSVLIITCPCALGLAVPAAHVVAAGRLFANGVLMKDGSALERMESIDTVAFDKTGTLTTNEPQVSTCSISVGRDQSIVKALSLRSLHPAARAIAQYLKTVRELPLHNLREVPGHGVEAEIDGHKARLGRRDWVAEIAMADTNDQPGIAFAVEGQSMALTTMVERIRPGARAMLEDFQSRGIAATILSGDHVKQVEIIARKLGFASYEASLKPGEKFDHLNAAAHQGHKLLMVGDGLNDVLALAAAHVSMAPSSGSDVGRTAADFVFTRNDLQSVSFAHEAAVATGNIVRQNFALAIVYNIFAVPLAITGQLNPLLAAIAMSTSSIIVVGNSLRLYRLKMKDDAVKMQNRLYDEVIAT